MDNVIRMDGFGAEIFAKLLTDSRKKISKSIFEIEKQQETKLLLFFSFFV